MERMHRVILENTWKVEFNVDECLPAAMAEWVKFKSNLLGVPDSYIAWPVLVAVAHASQHTFVNVGKLHKEPTAIYGLVIGRSGTYIFINIYACLLCLLQFIK